MELPPLSKEQEDAKQVAIYLNSEAFPLLGDQILDIKIRHEKLMDVVKGVKDTKLRKKLMAYAATLETIFHVELAQLAVMATEALFGTLEDEEIHLHIQPDLGDSDAVEDDIELN